MKALPPGSVIGILGGGQLGRMLSLAASRLGLDTHIYSPENISPAKDISRYATTASYEDIGTLQDFAGKCDVVTYEFENVPATTAAAVAAVGELRPGALALEIAQDRLSEKTFIQNKAGVAVAPFEKVDSVFDLRRAVRKLGLPAVLKTRRFGYDGKGQAIIRSEDDIDQAWSKMKEQPAILEGFVPFRREVSIVGARSADGEFTALPLIENVHKDHILHTSTCPTNGDNGAARDMSAKIMERLGYIGVMATEFFEMENGDLIVNEIAPRVHNSGHFSQNAGCCDQFEQHIRAVAGWPLGNMQPKHSVVMTNLIGAEVKTWLKLATLPNTHVHLYGKSKIRSGRKMGHVNTVGKPV